MTSPVTLPFWLFVLILLFAAASFSSNFLFPSVRWFLRRRAEKVVARLNERLETPIQPFKLARRYDLIQRLIYHPDVTRAIVEHADEEGVREDVAFERARRYAHEIVPSFSAFAYFGAGVRAARFLSNALYRVRLGHHDEAALAKLNRDATIVFVMNHRSNMDYVLVTYLAAERSALSYAVGEWAQVWPLSRLIRAMGAFFIRRKSRNALYRKVLSRYVQMATAGGVTQAMFPEGGLSLDGGLQDPKLGLLKYVTDELDLAARDVVFVPVAINYDRVLEDRVLIEAGRNGTRRFDAGMGKIAAAATKQLWLRLRGRFHRFGYAAVSFGAPLSLRDHPELAAEPEALAQALMGRIAAVVPVLPVPLVAHLLRDGPLDRAALEARYADTVARLDAHIHVPRDDTRYSAEVGLRALIQRGIVTEADGRFTIVPDQSPLAEFYARSIAHLF
ncbi:1-acyl-sn-glycerol-3-phosphate acyltransferase [Thalassococcus sp. CAU 1522]|uniref:Glycerol-3-phosphate acyltransferase n=1 Tax=Thalassococcus arenae TaxID=2851652 RepID=A0ABS6N8B2_9RHOB|nr:1-acyl-sn-glycerol-3-phosphate acyltransferase [Thalassococcus arenae]MBV2360260.1 1-acyl-sn-glycerol-3-phosphate acyltransferase [Thalassococcus arenae]